MPQEIILESGEQVTAWDFGNPKDVAELAEAGLYQCEGITRSGARCGRVLDDLEQLLSTRPKVPIEGKRHVCWQHGK